MPEGKTLNINKGEYPGLDSLEPNRKFTFDGEGTVEWSGENGVIKFNSFNIQTENTADKELRNLKGLPNDVYENASEEDVEM